MRRRSAATTDVIDAHLLRLQSVVGHLKPGKDEGVYLEGKRNVAVELLSLKIWSLFRRVTEQIQSLWVLLILEVSKRLETQCSRVNSGEGETENRHVKETNPLCV